MAGHFSMEMKGGWDIIQSVTQMTSSGSVVCGCSLSPLVSAFIRGAATARRPRDLCVFLSSVSFQALCHGSCSRWLMNCLAVKERGMLAYHQPLTLLLVSTSLSYLQPYISCFLLSYDVLPEMESPGGVNSSSVAKYIICWDLHVLEEGVKNTESHFTVARQQ